MANKDIRHPNDEQLLLYADGELTDKRYAQVQSHLEACWSCRARLDDLEAVIKGFVRFRDEVLLPMVPPPPRPWENISPRLVQLDEPARRQPLRARLLGAFLPSRSIPRYMVVGTAVLLVLAVLLMPPLGNVVSADVLLERVRDAELQELKGVVAPVVHQRLQVRRRATATEPEMTADYESWSDRSQPRFRQKSSSEELVAELQRVYEANQLEWQAPLSAAGLARWRDTLLAKVDSVEESEGQLTLTTIAGQNPKGDRIGKVQLVVRVVDWHPVQQRLWLADREYEITETQYEVLPLAKVEADVFGEAPEMAAARPSTPKREPTPDPAETELEVRYRLHQVGADLGEPIEVVRGQHGEVIVEALDITPERVAELEELLASIPNTSLDVAIAPETPCVDCETPPAAASDSPATPPVIISGAGSARPELLKFFGDQEVQEAFTLEALEISGAALSRAFALRRLAERYPPTEEAKLTPASQERLRQMLEEHATALVRRSSQVEGMLEPLLQELHRGTPVAPAGELLPDNWQGATLRAFAAVQQVDRLTKDLLASTGSTAPLNQIVAQLAQALAGQSNLLSQYRDLLNQENLNQSKKKE